MELEPFGYLFMPRMKDMLTVEIEPKPIVLCKNCNQWDEEGGMMGRGWCGYQMKCTGPYYFCADGENETDGDNTQQEP